DSLYGTELWISDGTAAGTYMLADLYVGGVPAWGSLPFVLTPVGNRWVYFGAFNAFGQELWRTDGTTTEMVQDIWTGSSSSNPQANGYPGTHLVNSRFGVTSTGKMFFFAADGVNGLEPWVFDTGVVAGSPEYGAACGGLTLAATTPYLGSTVTLTTSAVPGTALGTINFLSLTKYVPPIDLLLVGMPGCLLHCGLDVGTVVLGSGTALNSFYVPPDPYWLGFEIYSQSVAFVPGANPFGAITSNGVTLVIGDL
ncbi:MAG: hypothetical protein ABIP94_16445, partial [Planctomycetota bacterium]